MKEIFINIANELKDRKDNESLEKLVGILFKAGETEFGEAVLEVFVKLNKEIKEEKDLLKNSSGLEVSIFEVLEVRPTKKEGTVRAFCKGPEGNVAVYAKKGAAADTLADAIGAKVETLYRKMDNRKLFAIKATKLAQ